MFKRLHNFIVTHDEIKIFMIIYVAGARTYRDSACSGNGLFNFFSISFR